MTAERSCTVVVLRADSPGEAGLEHDQGAAEGLLNLREIPDIARDSGIAVSLVRQGARELDDDARGIAAVLAGAPLRRTIERVADAEIGADLHERIAEGLREVLSWSGVGNLRILPGGVSSVGCSLTLTGFTGTSEIEVNVAPREGKTLIRISVDRSQLAGGLFGGVVGGMGGGFGANLSWMFPTLLHLPWFAGVISAGLVVLGAYWVARAIFAANARGVDQRLNALADRLQAVARGTGEARSLPSSAV